MLDLRAVEINRKLLVIYTAWINSLGGDSSEFFDKSKNYSNPYYLGVPDDWCESAIKILFIGQEGYGGHWNSIDMRGAPYLQYDAIEKLQEANVKSVRCRISSDKSMEMQIDEAYSFKDDLDGRSGFWTSMRTIVNGNSNGDTRKVACAWTNLDLICHNTGKKRKLSVGERTRLHQVKAVLPAIIECIEPTHIVLFNWRDISIYHEFEDINADGRDGRPWHEFLGNQFASDDDKDYTIFATEIKVCGKIIPLLVTYRHPGYGKGRKDRDKKFCTAIYKPETLSSLYGNI